MTNLTLTCRQLRDDEDGASFIEYTVLLGVILAASIAVIGAVGGWAGRVWVNLNTAIGS
jgi:pilus assembly protein Flp/PilA